MPPRYGDGSSRAGWLSSLRGSLSIPLGRWLPFVPPRRPGETTLLATVATIAFLASLSTFGALRLGAGAPPSSEATRHEASVQLVARGGRDLDSDLSRVVALARGTPGIEGATILTKESTLAILAPYLGSRPDLAELPVPRLVRLRLAPGANTDLAGFAKRLNDEIPGAVLDGGGAAPESRDARLEGVASALWSVAILSLVAVAAATVFLVRHGTLANRSTVVLLRLLGAEDGALARGYGFRHALLTGGGAAIGVAAAFGGLVLLRIGSGAPAAGSHPEMLVAALIVAAAAASAGLASWATARALIRRGERM